MNISCDDFADYSLSQRPAKYSKHVKTELERINEEPSKSNHPSEHKTEQAQMSSMLHVNENFASYTLDKSPSNAHFNSTDSTACDDSSPYTIKRKSLNKQSANKFVFNNNSPYCLPSAALLSGTTSPKPLDDSFENLPHLGSTTITSNNMNNGESSSSNRMTRTTRYIQRRASNPFAKHRSAPLTGINLYHMYNNNNNTNPAVLSDISNHINYKCANSVNQPSFKSNDDSVNMETHDDITDLENLVFGTASTTGQSNSLDQTNYHHIVKQSLEFDAKFQNLIGDRSRQHILPVIPSNKHQDLHCISPETLVDVLNGKYNEQIDECVVIDSRYPYEYDGGHIATALNIYTKERLFEEMFIKRLNFRAPHKFPTSLSSTCLNQLEQHPIAHSATNACLTQLDNSTTTVTTSKDNAKSKRCIIIFHCEFSSERGPNLLRFLRSQDRSLNEHIYPNLFYPELYLLEGGYKSFYERFKIYCEPQTYKPMLHAEHQDDLRHFRSKAKSWDILLRSSELLHKKKMLQTRNEQEQDASDADKPRRVIKMKQKF